MSERARALEQARETALRTDAAYLSPSGRIVRVQGHKLTGRVIVDSRGRVAVRNVDTDRLSYVHEADLRELAVDPPPSGASYQQGVREWVVDCFGPTIADDKAERCFRFLEEALELVQSVGATREQAARLVEYVYERPVGQPGQEVGGVMVTLAALVSAVGIDMQAEAERELKRISAHDVREKIRRKQASKPVAVIGSPDAVLPQPSGASPQAEELRAANVANLREMVVMAGRHRETLLAVRECILALSPGHRTGYDWNADPLFLTLKEGRALNLIDDALKSTPASPQAETSANVRALTVHICEDCLNLRGEMCNEPGCRFCRRTMAEVAEYLDVLLIRPRIDGVGVIVDHGEPL